MEFSEVWEWRLLHDPIGLKGAERSRPVLNDPERECLTHDVEELMTMSPIDSQGLPSDATEGVWDSRVRRPSAFPSTSSFGGRSKPVADQVRFTESESLQHSKKAVVLLPSTRGSLALLLNQGGQGAMELIEGNTRRSDLGGDLKELRVHLPSRGQYQSANVVKVKMNAHMKVQDLIQDVLRDFARSHGLGSAEYELRLLEEDEGGPDLDWPALDPQRALANVQVTDVVLCPAGFGDSSSESPRRDGFAEEQSSEAIDATTPQPSGQRSSADTDPKRAGLRIDDSGEMDRFSRPDDYPRRRSDEIDVPLRPGPVTALTHRRVRSTPAGPAPLGESPGAEPISAENQIWILVELPIALDEQTHQLYFGTREAIPSTGVVRVQVGAAVAHEYVPEHLGAVDDNHVTRIPLLLSESASLQQVLHLLYRKLPSSEAAADFDPHAYAFECDRQGDVRRRLDPSMQVRHLDPRDVLTLMRKDALAAGNSASLADVSNEVVRRPPVWTINFTDYTASIACQYLVRVLPKNIRNGRKHQCHLVLDSGKLCHKMMEDEAQRASTSALGNALQRVKRGITGEVSHTVLYSERRLCDVEKAEVVPKNELGFVLGFRDRGSNVLTSSGMIELFYEAESPQHCAEIVARIQRLMNIKR
mmetsp:Transcript_26881/g.59471  ORF Transcript_26881/g.59471 Transcript_26881/m.59471 type:complete len:645 (-) Transcript_26881:24-1958(-)